MQISALSSQHLPTRPNLSAPRSDAAHPLDQVELQANDPQLTRRQIPGSFIVVAPTDGLASLASDPNLQVEKVLGTSGDSTFLLVQSPDRNQVEKRLGTEAMPNYEYSGQLFDEPVPGAAPVQATPAGGLPLHLDIIQIDPAWRVTKGNPGVTSAVTDTGADLAHPLLKDTVWHNPKEIAGNGIDDDNNGKIDDIVGWDFSDSDNNPQDTDSHHHTHVHGIVHAQSGEGVSGVAPGAKGMVLRIAGGKKPFSSAVLVESYLYALNQGAKSINTSLRIDGFVGDRAIESTYRNLAEHDVLLFNSAGNDSKRNPARSQFEDIVLVASTDTAAADRDKLSSYSNYGAGIDISAPGKDIMSTFPNGRVAPLSGTSMASPVAMGVDLLVQSAHPDWNRGQRWAQIAGTADKIDALNPNQAGELGFGRVNAGRALTETLAAPTLTVTPTTFPNGQTMNLKVHFDKVLDPASANLPEAWQVRNEQGEVVMQGPPKEVRLLTNQIDFNVSTLPTGSYTLVASAAHLHDPFGRPLDGNGDGVAGDDLVVKFSRI